MVGVFIYNVTLCSRWSTFPFHFVCTARNGVVNDPSKSLRILEMPLPLETAHNIIYGEADLLQEVLGDGKHDATLSALRSMLKKKAEVEVMQYDETVVKEEDRGGMFSGWMDSWNGCLAGGFSFDEICGDIGNVDPGRPIVVEKDNTESSMIYTVGDINCGEELVYALEVNPNEERITVVFRGSVTKVDLAADANINMIHVAEPSLDLEDEGDGHEIGLHQGFYEYLFKSTGSRSKFDQIMGHVRKLFKQDTNRQRHYKLYITGHGLGGALATLFGYYCAALSSRNQLPLPVTVVSVASPRVGDLAFARSFTELESQARLRHLRIAAYKDPMNLVPIHSSKEPLPLGKRNYSPLCALAFNDSFSDGGDVYCHTGIVMKLRNDVPAVTSQRVEIAYSGASYMSKSPAVKRLSKLDKEELEILLNESQISSSKKSDVLAIAQYHFGEAYSDRLELVDKDLSGFTLNRIYLEKGNIDHLIN